MPSRTSAVTSTAAPCRAWASTRTCSSVLAWKSAMCWPPSPSWTTRTSCARRWPTICSACPMSSRACTIPTTSAPICSWASTTSVARRWWPKMCSRRLCQATAPTSTRSVNSRCSGSRWIFPAATTPKRSASRNSSDHEVRIIAFERADGSASSIPTPDSLLYAGDSILACVRHDVIAQFSRYILD